MTFPGIKDAWLTLKGLPPTGEKLQHAATRAESREKENPSLCERSKFRFPIRWPVELHCPLIYIHAEVISNQCPQELRPISPSRALLTYRLTTLKEKSVQKLETRLSALVLF